ncbi:MAG: hypothetical protein MZW92_25265 [Comamonadaceae bacterium]|nr:hypothetical protein [Comamonadaceae bacterium]
MDAAVRIHGVEIELGAGADMDSGGRQWAAERRDLADHQFGSRACAGQGSEDADPEPDFPD